MDKYRFVRDYLTPMLIAATDHEVTCATYSVTPEGDEIVTVYNGYGTNTVNVRVNMDSLPVLVKDVLKVII